MTSREITRILALRHWSPRTHVLIPRCMYGGFEGDLLVMTDAGYLEEVEIKISLADFKREFSDKCPIKQYKHRRLSGVDAYHPLERKVKRFWFAVPHELVEKIETLVPSYAGLLSISRGRAHVVKNAPVLANHQKLSEQSQKQVMRLAYLRYWSAEEKEAV